MHWKIYLKTKIRKILNKFGYDAIPYHTSKDSPPIYNWCNPYNYNTFSPWFTEDFQKLYRKISRKTVVKEDRCYILHQLAKQCSHLPGNYAECGVYKGGTAFLVSDAISGTKGKELHLFDTFAGMPGNASQDSSRHSTEDFGNTSLNEVKEFLAEFGFIRYFPGTIPETLKAVESEKYCFVYVDVDLYLSVKDCCEFFYERLVPGGVMVFDDYGFERYIDAAKKAIDEFFEDKREEILVLRNAQCLVVKLPDN